MVGTEPVPPRGGQEGSCAFVPGENATAQDGAAHLRKTAAELKRDLFGEEWFLYVPEGPNPNRQLRPLDLGEAGLGEVCRASKRNKTDLWTPAPTLFEDEEDEDEDEKDEDEDGEDGEEKEEKLKLLANLSKFSQLRIKSQIMLVDDDLAMWRTVRPAGNVDGGVFLPLPAAGVKAEAWGRVKRIATRGYLEMFPCSGDSELEWIPTMLVRRLKASSYRRGLPMLNSRDLGHKRAVGSYFVAGKPGEGFHFDAGGVLHRGSRPGAITLVDELVDLPSGMELEELLAVNTDRLVQVVSDVSPDYLLLMHLHARAAAGCQDAVKWVAMIIGYYRNGAKSHMAKLMTMLFPSVMVAQPSQQEALVLTLGRGGLSGATAIANKYSRATFVLLDEMKAGEINIGWIKATLQRSGTDEFFPGLRRPLWNVSNKQRLVLITSNVQNASDLLNVPVGPEDAERALVVRVGPDKPSEEDEDEPPTPELLRWKLAVEELLAYLKTPAGRVAAISYILKKAKDPMPPLYSGEWPTLAREMAELRLAREEDSDVGVGVGVGVGSSIDRLMAYVRTNYAHAVTGLISLQELCSRAGVTEGAGGRKCSTFFSAAKKAMTKEFGPRVIIEGKYPTPGGGRSSSCYALMQMPMAGAYFDEEST